MLVKWKIWIRVNKFEPMDIYRTPHLIIRSYTFINTQNIYEI